MLDRHAAPLVRKMSFLSHKRTYGIIKCRFLCMAMVTSCNLVVLQCMRLVA
jgi:hypothetical protein